MNPNHIFAFRQTKQRVVMNFLKEYVEEITGFFVAWTASTLTTLSSFLGPSVFLVSMNSDFIHEGIKSAFVIFNAVGSAVIIHVVKKKLESRGKKPRKTKEE